MTARTMPPLRRGAFEIIRDFSAASERLAAIGADWRQSQFRAGDLANAASTIEGMRSLLVELRLLECGE